MGKSWALRLSDALVIVVVCGALLGAFLRWTVSRRESDRRALCQHRMRMISLAILGFANHKNHLPNAGTFYDDPVVNRGIPTQSSIYLAIQDPARTAIGSGNLLRNWAVDVCYDFDYVGLYNDWNRTRWYLDKTSTPGHPSNAVIGTLDQSLLRCPADPSIQTNQGNLSYVVNGGFSRWHAIPLSWSGGKSDRQFGVGPVLEWAGTSGTWEDNQAVARKLGVMFLGTHTGDQPWDVKTALSGIPDGTGSTLLLGENTMAGYSKGTSASGGLATNWTCPLPNFCMFIASDDVCRSPKSPSDCLGGQLRPPTQGGDGAGWVRANQSGTYENINYAHAFKSEGSSPFANSGHHGGCNFAFCDGAVRFISESIDGKIYANLVTPAGTTLPPAIRQSQARPGAD